VEGLVANYRAAGGILAGRVTDLEDVRDRVIARLTGTPEPGVPVSAEPFVLVAHDLAPADTALLDPATCRAIVTEIGSPTSHTAILARDLGIPAVVGAEGATDVADGTLLLVDGTTGTVIVDPTDADAAQVSAEPSPVPLIEPGRTRDGTRIALLANVGAPSDAQPAAQWGAEGIGLFRTEFCFLDRVDEPAFAEQVSAYREVFRAFAGRRVVVRTLDAGSDKPMPFLTPASEPNPALGVRGYRTSRTHPAVLSRQLDAIVSAAAVEGAQTWVMAPMISTIDEAEAFAALARAAGVTTVGVMVETPSAAAMAPELCAAVDFVSLGTNDLAQYTMGADRLAASLADLSDPWQPAVLRAIAAVADAGRASGTPVGVCGESAGIPEYAPVLVGLGVASLSMGPRRLPGVAAALAAVDLDRCVAAADAAAGSATAKVARELAVAALS
jgi:phosphotransferase system enzyme I (PtsI)